MDYSIIQDGYKAATGQTIDPSTIEAQIMTGRFGMEFAGMSDEEKKDFIAHKAPEIIADLVAVSGSTANPGEGAVAPSGEAQPDPFESLSGARKEVVLAELNRDDALRTLRTQKTTIETVLIARPCPSEWMGNVGKQKPKKDAETIIGALKKTYDGDILDWLKTITSESQTIVPNNAQLKALGEKWVKDHTVEGKDAPAMPAWANENNEQNVQDILAALQSDAGFDVMVARKDEVPEIHCKPWRWNTKGYEVTYPDVVEGGETFKTEPMSIQQLRNFLLTQAKGATRALPKGDAAKGHMYAELYLARPNTRKTGEATAKRKVNIRVRGNSAANGVATKVITEIAPGETKSMVVKSAMSYLVVRARLTVDNKLAYSVVRSRINLTWADAPVFTAKPEYAALPGMFPQKGGVTGMPDNKKAAVLENVMRTMLSQAIGDSAYAMSEGLSALSIDMDKRVAAAAAKDAGQFA